MMTIISVYWPVLVVALFIGIVSGVLAFRRRGPKPGE